MDAVSSSVIVSSAVALLRPVALPVRITVSAPSATVSSVGAKLNVPIALIEAAGMVIVKSLTAA